MPVPSGPRGERDRVAEVFGQALELGAAERQSFLDSACSHSPELRSEVESLLRAHSGAGGFLEQIEAQRGATLLEEGARAELGARRVGPYRLVRELGRGGMGVVYLAERAEGGFTQRVAIKLIKRGMDSEAILKRFLRERQILASFEHPRVARLLDGGVSEDGQPYFAMEYVDGVPLAAHCDGHRLGIEERLRLFEDACRAVQHAHGKLVVHRDLKPSNMLVTRDGELKLLDFGVAKLLATDEEDGSTLTREGLRPMTPDYAAPEQVRGGPITTATDVYALGVVLYELLAGRNPYADDATSLEALSRAVCEREPELPSIAVRRARAAPGAASGESVAQARRLTAERLARRLHGDLDTLVLKALAKEPERRYASAEALAEDVRRHLAGHPVQARPDTVRYRAAKFVRRHRFGVSAAAVATLSLLLGLLGTAWQARVAAHERDRARQEAERAEKVKEFLADVFKASDPAESKGQDVTARELLERGAERIDKELAGHPSLQAELLHTVADISRSLGHYEQARALEERSLAVRRKLYGSEHPEVALSLEGLGRILLSSGDLAAAEQVQRQALAIRRRLLSGDSTELADSLDNLGQVLENRANLAEAETLHREALAIRRRQPQRDPSAIATSVGLLANVFYQRGDYAAAAEQHQEALRLYRSALGEVDPRVASCLEALAASLMADGDLSGAEAANRESLALTLQLLGEEHRLVSQSRQNLARILYAKGDLQGAEQLFRQALVAYPSNSTKPGAAVIRANLALDLADQARFDEAMPLFEEAASLYRRISGPDHPFLARALEHQAGALVAQGRPREALRLLDQCLGIYRARYGKTHPWVASALAKLARARAELGEPTQAETLFRQALEIQRAQPKPDRAILDTLVGLGQLLVGRDRAAEAEPILRDAATQAERWMPAAHWYRAEIDGVLGACLWRLQRADDARRLLVGSHERLQSAFGEKHPATRRARQRLESARLREAS